YLYNDKLVEKYINALKKEIILYGNLLKDLDLTVSDIHVGGGTPSLIKPEHFKEITNCIIENFKLANNYDFGIEANPNDLNEEYVFKIRDAGINQLSIGIQSFNEKNLKILGRIHRLKDNFSAIKNASMVDYKHTNIDLMYFLPNQSIEEWTKDIKIAVNQEVQQVTVYPLLIVHYRPMYKLMKKGKIPQQPDKKYFNIFYKNALNVLKEYKYNQLRYYSFSKSKQEYSTVEREMVGPLIAFGSGAIGFTGGSEYVNTCYPEEYIKKIEKQELPIAGLRSVSIEERIIRWIQERLSALKFKKIEFKEFFKKDFNKSIPISIKYKLFFDKLAGNIKITKDEVELTEKGILMRNWIGWAFVLNVPCEIVAKYSKEPFPLEVSIP
ncbi:MAG: coproporphyrinogen-III oxidase family protein, partial [Thermoprotei archaeon]